MEYVLGRAMALLDAFGVGDGDLGLSELARRTGIPKPSVHRLAAQLLELGLLERAGPSYRLGVRLFELGQRVPRHRFLRDAALPFMEDLYVATRETVHLAVANGTDVLYLEKIAGHRPVGDPSRVAGRMPMHCTATGKAILAFSGPEVFDELVGAGLRPRTPFTIVVPDVLADELRRVRDAGVAFEREETRLGYGSVAAPLTGPHGTLVGALSVTAPTGRGDLQHLAPGVRTAALALSRVLRTSVPTAVR